MTKVYGYYRTAEDQPETGSVSLTPYLTVPNDSGLTRLITEKKVVSRLDENGYIELEVIPSDDPGWRTEGQESVPYLVEERLEGEIRDRLVFVLGLSPVDINLLPNVPVDTEGPVETPVPGIQGPPGPPGPPGGAAMSGWWSYSSLETEPPLEGEVRTTPATVVVGEQFTMFLHHIDDDGLDWSGVTALADDRFLLRSETGESWYTTVVSPVVGADYTAFTLTLDTASAEAPKKNTRVQVSLERSQPLIPEYLDDLADVDMATAAPTDGQAVVWSEQEQQFVPGGPHSDASHNHDGDYAAASHQHTESDITDLGAYPDAAGLAAGKMPQAVGDGTWGYIDTPDGGGGTGDHASLINRDAADQHPMGAVTGLTDALNGKATAAQGALADSAVQPGDLAPVATTGEYGDLLNPPPLDFAPVVHQHAMGDVTGLTDALDGKSPVDHNHDGDYAQLSHQHTEADISDLGAYPDATGQPGTKVPQTDGAGGWSFIDTPSGGGTDDHELLINLDKDGHGHYAPIHVIDAADPDPTEYQRPGQIVVRKGAAVNEGLEFLQKQGGTMTGPLLLQSDPASDMEAVPKQYVDTGYWMDAVAVGFEVASSTSGIYRTTGWTVQNSGGDGWSVTNDGIVVPTNGFYLCAAQTAYGSSGSGTVRILNITVDSAVGLNSGGAGQAHTSPSVNTSGYGFMITVTRMVWLTAGQVVATSQRQDSGATVSPNVFLQVLRVGM